MAFSDHLQKILQNIGMSPRDRAIEESFKGLNITGRNNALPANTENHGYTFFTRPYLNLSYGNCMIDRRLSMLQNPNPLSIERNIRAYLDPREHQKQPSNWCPGVDPLNPFITLLSNNLISLTGWEDFTLNYSTTPAGVYRDAMSYVDDVPYQYGTYDLQATMRNINGDPITWMLYIWEVYAGLGREGRILPYPELVILKEYDYNTRIYRLVMDATKTYITRLAACGAAAPLNAPTGQILNFTGDGSESPFQTTNEQLNFSFRCSGLTTYDHILIYEFNDLVETFNPMMREGRRGVATRKLAPNEKEYFNFQSYPYINGMTMELEWHVPLDIYNKEIGGKYTPTIGNLMSTFKDNLYAVRRDPSLMENLIYRELDRQMNPIEGMNEYDIPDGSLPFVFAVECGITETVAAMDEMYLTSRQMYPRQALNNEDL